MVWSAESDGFMTGTEGRVTYRGSSGSVTLYWNNPFVGGNDYGATPGGAYILTKVQGPKVGSNVNATYVVDRRKEPAPAPEPEADAADGAAPTQARPLAERPEEPGRSSHVPKGTGQVTVISPKDWLVDIAWQAVNSIEWSPLVLEITENRHGSQSGAACPGMLPTFPGVKEKGKCQRPHEARAAAREAKYTAALERLKKEGMEEKLANAKAREESNMVPNDFHSWCGDFVSWVFWKAWVLRGSPEDKITRVELGKFLNREALNGVWTFGQNLNMVEAYAKGLSLEVFHQNQKAKGTPTGLLVWHPPGDGYAPKPGDIFMADRKAGGHISIIASCEPEAFYAPSDKQRQRPHYRFMTLDGKSFDFRDDDGEAGWNEALANLSPEERKKIQLPQGKWQGVAQNKRSTDEKKDPLRGFIDTSKLREALGYR
ncbi:hypothetical protein [Sorangium sp. So ce693]|uniref:hypothetical protein n=1 Tax=Sorangium sp. So ce693 TaxID=3133318 RepID=UPI003F5F85AA